MILQKDMPKENELTEALKPAIKVLILQGSVAQIGRSRLLL
jgi:hypothetical protein